MAFTPSNLAITQLGACTLTIATINSNATASDSWASGIPDIQAVIPLRQTLSVSSAALAVSWTGTSGTIHLVQSVSETSQALTLLVLSGFVSDMTW